MHYIIDDLQVAGDITVKGLGIIRNQSGGQLKYTTYPAGFGGELSAFAYTTSTIGFGGFTKAPQVFVCGVQGSPGASFLKYRLCHTTLPKMPARLDCTCQQLGKHI